MLRFNRLCTVSLRILSLTFFLMCAVMLLGVKAIASTPAFPTVATYSIVAYDSTTGDLGVAVQSKFFAVGTVVPWAEAGVGAIASQAFGNPTYGSSGLALLKQGLPVDEVLTTLLEDDTDSRRRQLGIVDATGNSAAFTGDECLVWAGHHVGTHFSVQGNILVSGETIDAMAAAFTETEGMLGERLMSALEAGQNAGGDSRGMQSAALLVVRQKGGYGGYDDRYCDLRVDDHTDPIAELRRIFNLWKEHALVVEGYRFCDTGDWEKAFETGRSAIALNPDKGEPHYHLACYFSKAERPDEAFAELQIAVEYDSTLASRATKDPDFEPFYRHPVFLEITGQSR